MGKRTSEHLSADQPAKKKKKISSSSSADVSQEASKDTPFPRGGKSVLSSLEKRKIHQQVKQDLFSGAASPSPSKDKGKKQSKTTPRKKKTPTKKQKEADAPVEDTDDSIEGILQRLDRDAPSQANPITFHSINEGTTLLGAIREIRPLKLLITLPGSIQAAAPITEISDELTRRLSQDNDRMSDDESEEDEDESDVSLFSLFQVGQLVRCVVTKKSTQEINKGGNKTIKRLVEVSLRPALINQNRIQTVQAGSQLYGAVAAEEDYGYVVHFDGGAKAPKGFLKKPSAPATPLQLQVGQLVECAVTKSYKPGSTAAIPVALADSDHVANVPDLNIQSLSAGLLAQSKIIKVVDSGLVVRLYDFFNATIHMTQMTLEKGQSFSKRFEKGQQIVARLVRVDYETKSISLSLKPHVVDMVPHEFPVKLGDILENCRVTFVRDDLGLSLQLASNPPQEAFVHVNAITDGKAPKKLTNDYKTGQKVTCRVTGFNVADGIAEASMAPSVMSLDFLQHDDLAAGTPIRAVVTAIEDYGLIVKVSEKMYGLVPQLQLADVLIRKPKAKFKIDQKVKCRVLYVDPQEKRINLTAKKTLVNSTDTIVSSYDVKPGTVAHGFVKAVKDRGLVVSFYNKVTAFAPIQEVTDQPNANLSELFYIGQPVHCRVISTKAELRKMLVSFRVAENTEAYEQLEYGSEQSGTILRLDEGFCTLQLECGVRARLRNYHLSDIPQFCDTWKQNLSINQKLTDLVIIDKPANRPVELTRKFALRKCIQGGQFPASAKDFQEGQLTWGYVKRVSQMGIHVGFFGRLMGFVPREHIADQFVSDPEKFFQLGQTVRAMVIQVEGQKIILSLKQSLCHTDGVQWMRRYFQEENILSRTLRRKNKKNKVVDLSVGQVIEGSITSEEDFGYLVDMGARTTGFLTTEHAEALDEPSVGDSAKAIILDINQEDAESRQVDLSTKSTLLKSASGKKAKKLQIGQKYKVCVEAVKRNYLVVSAAGSIGFASISDYNSLLYASMANSFSVGQQLDATLAESELDALYDRAYLFQVPFTTPNPTRSKSESKSDAKAGKNLDLATLSNIKIGMTVTGKIAQAQAHVLKVTVGQHVVGRVDITEAVDEETKESPLASYEDGQTLKAKVIKITEIPSKRFLPISHQNPVAHRRVDLSIRPSRLALPDPEIGEEPITWDNATEQLNKVVFGAVVELQQKNNSLAIQLSPDVRGIVHPNFMPKVSKGYISRLYKHFSIGQVVRCRVISVDTKYKAVGLSLRLDEEYDADLDDKAGQIVIGKLVKIVGRYGLLMDIGAHQKGFVSVTEISDKYSRRLFKSYTLGKHYTCVVLPRLPGDVKNVPLSMRESRLQTARALQNGTTPESQELTFPVIENVSSLEEGQAVWGYTHRATKGQGIVVTLSRSVAGFVPHNEIADKEEDCNEVYYSPGRLVRALVLSVQPDEEHPVVLTIKPSRVFEGNASDKYSITWATLEQGQKLKGYVHSIHDYGILVELKHAHRIRGLCYKTNITDKEDVEWKELFAPGDYVMVAVLSVDKKKKKLSLGMKASLFTQDDLEFDSDEEEAANDDADDAMMDDASDEEEDEEGEMEELASSSKLLAGDSDSDDEELAVFKEPVDDSDDEEMDDEESADDDEDSSDDEEVPQKSKTLQGTGFQFNDFALAPSATQEEDSEDSDESDEEEDEGASKRAKKLAKQREEEKTARKEDEMLDGDKPPETIADFERLLVASPNDSFLWIKYMAFLLSLTEMEKARAVVERGLKRINLREEDEKLNLWVAYMNLELMYGTEDSLLKVIERALSYNEPKQVYLRLVDIYTNADKLEKAEDIYDRMIKKYKHSKGIWIKYCTFCMLQNESDKARKLFQRAIKVLPQRKHIPLINKFAQLEYQHGDSERGRTMYEGVISNYPKKIDIWSVYIDMELKYTNDVDAVRRIFERATSLSLSSKKMKFLFTRFLNFEKEHGDEDSVEHVKQKVVDFLENSNNS